MMPPLECGIVHMSIPRNLLMHRTHADDLACDLVSRIRARHIIHDNIDACLAQSYSGGLAAGGIGGIRDPGADLASEARTTKNDMKFWSDPKPSASIRGDADPLVSDIRITL
jgi:hypothetical protein